MAWQAERGSCEVWNCRGVDIGVGTCIGLHVRPSSISRGTSRGSSRICCTRRTSAPGCVATGCASGLLAFGTGVSRDDDDDGGGLLCIVGARAGLLGSLVPAIPSDDGELSHRGGFMELHVGSLEETEFLRREEGFGTPTNRRWVEDDGDVGDFGDSSMAVVKCAIALSSATSEW